MVEARATWVDEERFVGQASSGHGIVVDGAQVKSGNSPTELVLIGFGGWPAIVVVSILPHKREPLYRVGGRDHAESAPAPPNVYIDIKLVFRVSGKGFH